MIRSAPTTVALVAISARRARILRWRDGEVIQLETLSEVPGRHRSTGHVRRDPLVRHGGSGAGQDAIDGPRGARIHEFVARVAAAVEADGRVLVRGNGRVPEELFRCLQEHEHGRPDPRPIVFEHGAHLTDGQLRARLLAAAGHPARRRDAPQRPQVGMLRRSLGRSGEREAIEAQLDAWGEGLDAAR